MCNNCDQRVVIGDNEHCLIGNNPDDCDGLPAKSYTSYENYCNDEIDYAKEKMVYFQVNPYAKKIWDNNERQEKITFWQGQVNNWEQRLKEYKEILK